LVASASPVSSIYFIGLKLLERTHRPVDGYSDGGDFVVELAPEKIGRIEAVISVKWYFDLRHLNLLIAELLLALDPQDLLYFLLFEFLVVHLSLLAQTLL